MRLEYNTVSSLTRRFYGITGNITVLKSTWNCKLECKAYDNVDTDQTHFREDRDLHYNFITVKFPNDWLTPIFTASLRQLSPNLHLQVLHHQDILQRPPISGRHRVNSGQLSESNAKAWPLLQGPGYSTFKDFSSNVGLESDSVLESIFLRSWTPSTFLRTRTRMQRTRALWTQTQHTIDLLSHITSCTKTVCLRKFSGCLVSIFLTPIIWCPYRISVCFFTAGYCGYSGCQGYTCHKLTLKWSHCSMQVEPGVQKSRNVHVATQGRTVEQVGVMI